MELGKKYAFVRNGVVESIEGRTYTDSVRITDLYHADVIKDYFFEIPGGQTVEAGFLLDNTGFTPPVQPQDSE